MKIFAVVFVAFVSLWAGAVDARSPLQERDCAGSLRQFVIAYLENHRDPAFPVDVTTKVQVAKVSFGRRYPKGFVIYIRSGGWCGSAGCTTLFVRKSGRRFQPAGFVAGIMLPILVEKVPGAADAEFVVNVRNQEHTGMERVTLSVTGDIYGFKRTNRVVGSDGPTEPVVVENTRSVGLY